MLLQNILSSESFLPIVHLTLLPRRLNNVQEVIRQLHCTFWDSSHMQVVNSFV
jgi:hypothetical protein